MVRLIYSLVFTLLLPVILGRLLYRAWRAPAYARRWHERFALKGDFRPGGIWVHAVSVGESIASAPMIRELMRRYPDLPITVTCMTPTGSAQIRKLFGNDVGHAYLPYDLPWLQRRFIRRLAPQVCIIMETELWPNLVAGCKAAGVPVVLANARLSERSARGYQRIISLVRPMFTSLDWVAVQSEPEARRFAALGVREQAMSVTGSIKFDLKPDPEKQALAAQWRAGWADRYVWIAASTHAGEDEQVLEAHREVLRGHPQALLILVPRHPERFDSVARLISDAGLRAVRRSTGGMPTLQDQVFLGDTMGELMQFFGCSDVAFVGGSLVPNGGHNYLEPAALGLPVLSGPHRFNFTEVSDLLERAGALKVVENASCLAEWVCRYLGDSAEREEAGAAGKVVVLENQGALERLLIGISRFIGKR